ncbi:hypothetical protein D3C84_913790 [compost metagenome]
MAAHGRDIDPVIQALDQLRLLLLPLAQSGFNLQGADALGEPCVNAFNGFSLTQPRVEALQPGGRGLGQIPMAGLQVQG